MGQLMVLQKKNKIKGKTKLLPAKIPPCSVLLPVDL